MFSSHTFLLVELLRTGIFAILYSVSIFGWGCLVCDRLRKSGNAFADFILCRAVMGCFVLYAFFLLLSLGGLLRPAPVAVVLGIGLVFGLLQARRAAAMLGEEVRQIPNLPRDQQALLALVCFLAVLQIACGFTPLTFYDSQVYQLLGPVEFLKAGSLVQIPWNVQTNGPMALQLTLGMSWVVDAEGATFKLLLTLCGCLLLLGAARIGGQVGVRSAMVAALFVAAYPEFWIHQTFGGVDLAVASFLILGMVWWVQALRQQSWTWTVLAGVAFGFVVASRYQGVVLVGWILLAAFVFESFRDHKINGQNLLRGVAVAAIITLMAFPWLLRNYSYFGNPVFPLLQSSLGGAEWSSGQAAQLQYEVMGPALTSLSARDAIMAPVSALLMVPSNGLFGLGLLLGSLMAVGMSTSGIRLYAIAGIGGLIIWGLIHPTPGVQLLRYNTGSLVLLLTCTGAVLGSERFQELKGSYVAAVLALGSFAIGIVALHGIVPVWQTLTSSSARIRYWQANVPSWQVFEFANNKLNPAHDKILLIGETRALWLRIPFLAPSSFNGPQLVEVFAANEEAKVWVERLHQLGVTHILISSSEWQRLADGYGYFRLADEHLNRFNVWVHMLPVLFDDHQGNVLLSLP